MATYTAQCSITIESGEGGWVEVSFDKRYSEHGGVFVAVAGDRHDRFEGRAGVDIPVDKIEALIVALKRMRRMARKRSR